MRIAVITDIHLGPNTGNVFGDRALELLSGILPAIKAAQPDLLIELGDRLTDVDPTTDEANLRELALLLRSLDCPRLHLRGNHDLLPLELQEDILDTRFCHQVIEQDGWQIIGLETANNTIAGALDHNALDFLERQLLHGLPALVCSHQPLHGQALIGNRYFERDYADHACPRGAEAARGLFVQHPPRLCLSGHAHWHDRRQVDGIDYLTLQSLTESWATNGQPAQAWALLDLGKDIEVKVFGL
jgi:3',5'-cyclic-AMP phosphodiesterase